VKAAVENQQPRVHLVRWRLDPGNVAPMTGLEKDMGRHAATGLNRSTGTFPRVK
jgi:hypothetical protein